MSSYENPVDFGEVLKAIVHSKRPLLRIAEYGILKGYSLEILDRYSPEDCVVEARDIFDEFDGNCAVLEDLQERFSTRKKVVLIQADFHNAGVDLPDASYDLLHVDIANCGVIYREALHTLLPKLAAGGQLLLEGGSPERDRVPWMLQYCRAPIAPFVCELQESRPDLEVLVYGVMPGLVSIRRRAA
jgi:hypothetical protein